MRVELLFREEKTFYFFQHSPRIAKTLLWHTGADITVESYTRSPINVISIFSEGEAFHEAGSLAALEASESPIGSYFQDENWLYIRKPVADETPFWATSKAWLIPVLIVGVGTQLADEYDPGTPWGIVSDYEIQRIADEEFGQMSLTRLNIVIAKERLSNPENLIGSNIEIYIPEIGKTADILNVSSAKKGLLKSTLICKDLRHTLKEKTLTQHYNRDHYKNDVGNSVLAPDMEREFKKDVVGYCFEVPTDCINSYAYDTQDYRLYRAGYGRMSIDRVEIQQGDGWGEFSSYTIDEITETLPSGETIITEVLKIDAIITNPPEPGSVEPTYDNEPRKIRITGLFHSEIPEIEKIQNIVPYLFKRYSNTPFTDVFFDLEELERELETIPEPVGVYIGDSSSLADVIEKLQGGCSKGWQLFAHNGKFTARVYDREREPWGELKTTDILNETELVIDYQGDRNYSEISVEYAFSNTEEKGLVFTDQEKNQKLKELWTVKNKKIETLLKNTTDAEKRLKYEIDQHDGYYPVINDIRVCGEKWFWVRQFDILEAEFGEGRKWVVLEMKSNIKKEETILKIKKIKS
ncbi:MAG: hypothetical protein WAP07_04450 [Acutalibacteraceae bacterium]